jgi:hypothetical protein
MLKLGIMLVGILVLGLGLLALRSYVSTNEYSLSSYIQGLMNAPNQDGILIINISGTSKFVQFTGGFKYVQMDFPMVTSEQKAFRTSIESVADSMGLSSAINIGTDGSEFLDYDLHGSPSEISNVVETFITKLHGDDAMEKLRFEKHGY